MPELLIAALFFIAAAAFLPAKPWRAPAPEDRLATIRVRSWFVTLCRLSSMTSVIGALGVALFDPSFTTLDRIMILLASAVIGVWCWNMPRLMAAHVTDQGMFLAGRRVPWRHVRSVVDSGRSLSLSMPHRSGIVSPKSVFFPGWVFEWPPHIASEIQGRVDYSNKPGPGAP